MHMNTSGLEFTTLKGIIVGLVSQAAEVTSCLLTSSEYFDVSKQLSCAAQL